MIYLTAKKDRNELLIKVDWWLVWIMRCCGYWYSYSLNFELFKRLIYFLRYINILNANDEQYD
jgi:hypothetical protein